MLNKEDFYLLVEELYKGGFNINWKDLSETSELSFIEEHIDVYPFNYFHIARNKNLTYEFLVKYEKRFIDYEMRIHLREIDIGLIKSPYLLLDKRSQYIYYIDFQYDKINEDEDYNIVNDLFDTLKADTDNIQDYIFVSMNSKLYIFPKIYEDIVVDYIKDNQIFNDDKSTYDCMSALLKHNSSLRTNFHNIENYGVLVRKLIEDISPYSHSFLDNILKNKKEKDIEYFLSMAHNYHKLLKTYDKIDDLIYTVSSVNNDLRYLTSAIPCYVIEKYFDNVKWNYNDILDKEDITKELYEKIIKLNLQGVLWDYTKPFITKQFLLDNPSIIPNDLSSILYGRLSHW